MSQAVFDSQRLDGNAVFEAQLPQEATGPQPHEVTLGQAWGLLVASLDESVVGQRWLQEATQPHEGAFNQRWFQAHTVIHQTRFNQRWGLYLRTIAEATFNQTWDLNAHQAHETELTQAWGLIIPAPELFTLDQRWFLDARSAHLAVLNQRYRLEANIIWQPVVTAVHYTLILTGSADSLSDLVLPMSSFQGRLRSGSPSYLSVVIPAAAQYSDAIDARPNGQLVVSRGDRWTDGLIQVTELARVNLETIRLDQGARSSSATLSGHRQTTNSTPKTVTLGSAQVRAVAGGLRRYRCALDNDLRAGDTAEINGESLIVREISYTVGPALAFMEIAE